MTIKHLGGIFGRNPTFNDVTIDGPLSANDNIVMANGKGIDFSATSGTGTSELFDDYEEGTWTPAYSTSGGTITTANDGAVYTKVGRVVNVYARIYTSSITAAGSGGITITGLPYTSGPYPSIPESFWAVGRSIRWGSNPPLGIGVSQNTTSLTLYSSGSSTGDDVATSATDFNTGAGSKNYLWICGSYTTA